MSLVVENKRGRRYLGKERIMGCWGWGGEMRRPEEFYNVTSLKNSSQGLVVLGRSSFGEDELVVCARAESTSSELLSRDSMSSCIATSEEVLR